MRRDGSIRVNCDKNKERKKRRGKKENIVSNFSFPRTSVGIPEFRDNGGLYTPEAENISEDVSRARS